MAQDSFTKQFPGYDVIPEKKNRWAWPLTWLAFIALIAAPVVVFRNLTYAVPTPNVAGINKLTLPTLKQLALLQVEEQNLSSATSTLQRYFMLGGQEPEVMALYAQVLQRSGRGVEAKTWESKASRAVRDAGIK